jgi:hypothetical protein
MKREEISGFAAAARDAVSPVTAAQEELFALRGLISELLTKTANVKIAEARLGKHAADAEHFRRIGSRVDVIHYHGHLLRAAAVLGLLEEAKDRRCEMAR